MALYGSDLDSSVTGSVVIVLSLASALISVRVGHRIFAQKGT